MDAKEKNYKAIIHSTIAMFLAHTTIILFIFSLTVFWIKFALKGFHNDLLTVCLSLIAAILIYHSMHFACQSSTIENLKQSKLDQKGANIFLKKMNLVFVLCMLGSILFCLSYFILDRITIVNTINQTYEQYSFVSQELTNKLVDYIGAEYHASFFSKIYSTLIVELSFVISCLSLIPYQKKILEKYNK